jgi:Asp-tRNA(Asn)/Glu-tRNA(Gln) amidotransferase A subunit family amidase
VALAVTLGDYPVEPGVEANTRAFAAALAAAGAVVEEVEVDLSRELVERALFIHFGGLFGPSMLEFGAEIDDERFMPYTRLMLQRSTEAYRAYGTYQGLGIEAAVQAAVARVFEQHDVLVTPTTGAYGLLAGDDHLDGVDIAGRHYESYAASILTPVFNIASRHPVLNVPSGLGPNGVPTGVQVVARPYDDVTAFQAGAAAERELGLWNDPAWRPAL